MGLVLALVLSAPTLSIQPGVAFPGDPVLFVMGGLDEVPKGRFDGHPLSFVPCPAGHCALVGLSVDLPQGTYDVSVDFTAADGPQQLAGTLEVLAAAFQKRQLTVSKRFTSPSKAQRLRSAQDAAAFAKAFDRGYEALKMSDGFGWPRPPVITAPFGDLRLLNGKKNSQHFGVDLDGSRGQPIRAAADGDVVMVRDCFASGQTVLVHHGARLFTAYFHLSRFAVKEGQRVKQGALLGDVGSTGRVTGPHLHWGAKLDGSWVNPIALLALDFTTSPAQR